jgi:hypothetical protein
MQKAFLFPGLLHLGYDSGFSIPLSAEFRLSTDLKAVVTLFSGGCFAGQHEILLNQHTRLFYRGWMREWFSAPIPCLGDELFCVRLISPSRSKDDLPNIDIEGQMIFKQKDNWVSSILTGFVPVRKSGHQFAPVIHTAHYISSESEIETITLFMNIKDLTSSDSLNGGLMNAEISSRSGEKIASIQFPVKGNATLAVSSDDLVDRFHLSKDLVEKGVNIKFWGGSSQFSILTLYRNRLNGSIGLEHSLRPLYYLPDLLKSSVRTFVFDQLG